MRGRISCPPISNSNMDVFQAVSGYITKMVSAGDGQAGSKMKILLLDSETASREDEG